MTHATASAQLSEIWRTRPVRLPDQGPGAGVAAGIGHRYRVDPVLVRVAFVVSTLFGGSGLVLYLAAWLVLPRRGDVVSPAESLLGRGRTSESHTTAVVLSVALVISVLTVGPLGMGSGLVSTIAMLGALYLLFRRTPNAPSPVELAGAPLSAHDPAAQQWNAYSTLPDQYVPEPAAAHTAPVSFSKDTPDTPSAPPPPSWDPLGVAPFAWDLPEPGRPVLPVPAPARKSHLTSTVIGLAIIASAVTIGIGAATGAAVVTAPRVGAVALTVVGIGLIIGAFLRRGYGLLVLAAPLAGFVLVSSLVDVQDLRGVESPNMGNVTIAPTSMAALAPSYESGVGNFVLDLRGLDLTEDRTVTVEKAVGNTEILLSPTMNVVTDCTSAVGNANCVGTGGVDGGSDGTAGPTLTIEASTALGNLEVHRDR
ncbi:MULTISPECIES: PspC domain-containing protein [Nocardiaceae]|uniref:Phage shock protein PspC (Stress-responsive transcriptional regulator) n=1 Tax=Rhodococcoides corynebacterioides TaxID=53972 RepID=A0ABS2KQ96_9NOCA|nr:MULTISPECIES: PspC domain-containing protein [Rhodococcus]MBM7414128.1 phage shock protein PspC (stress-responsive transcriptional regulator) [Rhodococcus corynebacterioides]MBP1116591.1 phage shock protein PspC (stress-responsive transcriptional regulator) [Rhodococcus sp. PvP016]